MLRKPTNKVKKNIFLEGVGPKHWRIVYDESLQPLLERFEQACEYTDNGEYNNASLQCNQLIDAEPLFIEPYSCLALIAAWDNNEEEGKLILEKGIETVLAIFPENFFADHNKLEWGWQENRPFLNCYADLGLYYLEYNFLENAQKILENILTMNPNDNQGIRDHLLNCYLKQEYLEEALNLCNKFNDDILPSTNYGKAFILYKLGRLKEAETQFISAMEYSPRVAKELLKTKHIKPKNYGKGPGILVGGQEEAYDYWLSYGHFWKSTPGIIPFIKNCVAKAPKTTRTYDEAD